MGDRGIPNSISFNAQINKEKLPLALIVSASLRGTSPTHHQTLDQPTQLLFAHKYSTPDPDPDPATVRAYPQAAAAAETSTSSICSTKYRECLKNHAASMGNYVVDGCGEFMPGGEVGTFEPMRCAACNCHRSFHRRVDASHILHHQPFPAARTHPIMMSFGGATAESSSEDFNMFQSSPGGHAMASSKKKKRFRTKFNQEQKDRMDEFAEKLGWRIQRQDDEQVQQFCKEVGVKRQVFKVWMHNNKQAMKKKRSQT